MWYGLALIIFLLCEFLAQYPEFRAIGTKIHRASIDFTNRRNRIFIYIVVALVLIMCLELIATFLQIKCNPMKKFFEGKPILLIAKGEIQVEALKNMRVSINELISECRQQGAADIGEVNYAILEPNGKLSVFPKVEHSPITPHVLSTNQRESGILHLLIADGAPQKDVMKKLEISMDDLKEMCQKKHGSIKEMLVFGINDSGDILAVSKKEKRK